MVVLTKAKGSHFEAGKTGGRIPRLLYRQVTILIFDDCSNRQGTASDHQKGLCRFVMVAGEAGKIENPAELAIGYSLFTIGDFTEALFLTDRIGLRLTALWYIVEEYHD